MRIRSVLFLTSLLGLGCASAPPPPPPAPPSPAVNPQPTGPSVSNVTLEQVGLDGTALDKSVDPCEDFYQFACGGWIARTQIPADQPRWIRSFSEIHQRNEADLRGILDEARSNPGDDPASKTLGTFYGSCMDEAAVEKAGIKPIEPLLDQIRKTRQTGQLTATITELHKQQVWAVFDIDAVQDFKDATSVIAYVDQSGLGLPDRDYYTADDEKKKEIREFYAGHIARMMGLAGFSKPNAAQAARDVMRIETELAKVSKSKVERRDPEAMYNKIDRVGLEKVAGHFGWKQYFEGLGHGALQGINVTAPAFFERFDQLLTQEKIGAWRNYLAWQVVQSSGPYLNKALQDESFALTQKLSGQKEQRSRWKRCVEATDSMLGDLLAQKFVEKRFAGDSKVAAERYVQEISKSFARGLDGLDWMDAKTRKGAEAKLSTLAYLIGYPKHWKQYDFAVTDAYAANILAGSAFDLRYELAQIGKPVDRERWEMTAPTVNAYYEPLRNHMVFPAGILQPPFYSVTASIPVNLGAMGMVVGHELTHGFDDEGSKFDKDGNLNIWWTQSVIPKFEAKTACVEKQYDAFEPVAGEHINGKLTLGENIADLGGVKLAFGAYRAMRAGAAEVQVADGFTEDQQFFLATAQLWCAKMTDEYARLQVQNDPHSHPRFRVNGPMSNVPEFSEAWKCEPGSGMRPDKTCAVW